MDAGQLAQAFLVSTLRFAAVCMVAGLCFWILFRPFLQRRVIQPIARNARQLKREALYSLLSCAIYAGNGALLVIGARAGVFKITSNVPVYWIALNVVLMLLFHDAYFYWTHRALHTRLLYRFHKVHHQSRSPTPLTAYAFHPVETIVSALFLEVYLLAVPTHPLTIFVAISIQLLINVFGHSGVEVYPHAMLENRVFRWLATPTFHERHHMNVRGNYGLYFRFWDATAGTEQANYRSDFARTADQPSARIAIASFAAFIALSGISLYLLTFLHR